MKLNITHLSPIHSHLFGSQLKSKGPLRITAEQITGTAVAALRRYGVNLDQHTVEQMHAFATDNAERANQMADAMDSNNLSPFAGGLPTLNPVTIGTPIQFLQTWLPGIVHILTAARKADLLVGVSTVGAWEDEQVVQQYVEPSGRAAIYQDHTNVPLTSWNPAFDWRTVIRFELGFNVGKLEAARAARMRVDTAAEKRTAVADAMEISRNRVAFYGYNDGANRTYGLFNDPSLPAYVTVPNGAAGSPLWKNKTFNEITADMRVWLSTLRINSLERVDPKSTPIVFALPSQAVDYLSVTNGIGSQSAMQWLKENYPNVRVESAPEFNDANGGASAAYIYAESITDGVSSDDGAVFAQLIPAKFQPLGVEQKAKGYVEDFTNATAGIMCKRPFAVYRATGI